jgi:CTP:molybdopterin cytidylyltransferase MocA/xanthine/CO dehydrogenase XdhC/CoxF family maturation factor
LLTAAQLAREGVAFVLMTVVRAVAPTSAKPGDKAILTERGEWIGWIGGSCAEPSARRAARAAFADGQSRLLHLTNDEAHLARPGVELAAMSCYSGGSLEIYVEPHLHPPALVVFGHSPAAEALCRLGRAMDYCVTHVDLRPGSDTAASSRASVRRIADLPEPLRASTHVVVSSHGHCEVEALEWALRRDLAYVGLVTSRRRWPDVLARLEQRGLGAQAARVHAPAGLELGAARPEEVALSVLSQIVAERRGGGVARSEAVAAPASASERAAVPAVEPESCCAVPGAATDAGCCAPSIAVARATASLEPGALKPSARQLRFAAVVLAAGLSRRMGAPNKLLLSLAGEPLIARTVRTVLHTGFDQIVVVLGHQAELVERALQPLGVRCVLNPDFETGQVSSVRAGLAALVPPVDAVMICLGDQPLLEVSDLGALKRAFRERPHGSIVVPTLGQSRGNPVVVDWSSAEQTLRRGEDYGCRNFLDEHPERVYRWPAPNERFLRDVDLPGDYQALIERTGA